MLNLLMIVFHIHVHVYLNQWGRHDCGRDHMVAGFTTTYAIGAYHHYSFEFEFCSWRGVLDTTLCDQVCQSLAAGQ